MPTRAAGWRKSQHTFQPGKLCILPDFIIMNTPTATYVGFLICNCTTVRYSQSLVLCHDNPADFRCCYNKQYLTYRMWDIGVFGKVSNTDHCEIKKMQKYLNLTTMYLTMLTHTKFSLYKGFHDVTPWLINFKKYRIKFLILNFCHCSWDLWLK